MTINERFFKLLDEKKVSQKDFCEATGYSEANRQRLEK